MPRLSKIGAAALAAFGWTSGSSVTASYLVVAGGGGGGGAHGGGGGAGGLLTGSLSLNPSLSYTVTVGAGGVGTSSNVAGNNGSNSTFSTATAIGGGGGGAYNGIAGVSGGSGGGGGGGNGTPAGGSGTVGQGNAGGSGNVASYREGGGGGGAGATGGNASTTVAGNGGAGSASSITGSSVTYAGGGGGGSNNAAAGSGGSGGGGAGGSGSSDANGNPGTANLGGGGGGAGGNASGGNGGSGVVIISYTAPQKFSGGVVTTSGGNVIHTFTTSGTLGPITTLNASYLIVAGGGSGGNGNANIRVYGGGGAGGMLTGSGLTIDPNSTYLVTVGAGGASQTTANSYGFAGSNSTFSMVATAAVGGGSAGTYQSGVGGSGGGGGNDGSIFAGAAGTSGQGNAGGNGDSVTGGGGGGAGAVGGTGTGGTGGTGGAGLASSISGTSTYYAGGGGGGGSSSNGAGGIGGGSTGNVAATANTGGGGGGTATNIGSGAGGSGIVIISYPGSTQQMAGGTVTITGGNVIHTFTSTGYLAPLKYVNNSLRFRSSASAYLSRTPTATSNRRTWTWSGWVKLGAIGQWEGIFNAGSSGNQFAMYLYTDYTLYIQDYTGSNNIYLQTTQVFRDPAAWYHIVFAVDTTQATSTNRFKLYVNGSQVTSFVSTTYPSQNYDTQVNSTSYQNNIGLNYQFGTSNAKYFDGYMTEINFVDGQALTPNSFGTFNSYGVWQPITYGGSYGTNGFYLPFTSNASSYAGYFNSGSQYLETTATQIIPATGDFTIEAMTYMTSFANYPEIAVQGTTGNAGRTQFGINSSGQLFIGVGAGGGNATGISMALNRWYYVAVTRSGSTFNCYVNGILAGTITASVTVQNTTLRVGIDWGGDYTNGYISNLRISNVVRTISPATAPTSDFSNDANTVFLTLQGSTIVDNSSNAYAITNNGSVTVGKTYPFAYTVFNDQSPQGNNWTPNNISGVTGTTLDYMTDVPTLTSATAANYCTWNPLNAYINETMNSANLNLSDSNSAAATEAGGTIAMVTGKWYWEITLVANNNDFHGGVIRADQQVTAGALVTSGKYAYAYGSNGYKWENGTQTNIGTTIPNVGDILMVAYDADTGKVWYGKNGTWISSGNPAAGTNNISTTNSPSIGYVPYGRVIGNGAAETIAANFGQRLFAYTPPSGYVALNTYNL